MNTLSWATATTRRCRWKSIRASRSSGCSAARACSTQRLARMQNDRSILDSVRDDVKDLQGGLGPQGPRPAQRLPRERPRDRAADSAARRSRPRPTFAVPDAPIGVPESFEEHVGLQFDLLALALRGEHHQGVHVHDEPRREPARVSEHRRRPSRTTRCRTTATTRRSSRTS